MKTELLLGAGALYFLLKSKKRKKEDYDVKTYRDITLHEVLNLPENQRWLEKSLREAETINNILFLILTQMAGKLAGSSEKTLIASNGTDANTENAFKAIEDFITNSEILKFFKSILGGTIGEMLAKPYGRLYLGFEDLRKYAAALWFYDNVTVTLSQKFTHVPTVARLTINEIAEQYPAEFRLYNTYGRLFTKTKDEGKNNTNLPGGHYFITSIHHIRPGNNLETLIEILDEFDVKKLIVKCLVPSKPIAILSSKNFYTTVDP